MTELLYQTALLTILQLIFNQNKYVDSCYCQTEMYAGHIACCPLVSHSEYADGTDRRGQHNKCGVCVRGSWWADREFWWYIL